MTSAEGVRGQDPSRLALALDVDDAVAANRLARELRPWFEVVKVGLELFTAAGPAIVHRDDRQRLPGVPRPEAGGHPHHRGTHGAGSSGRSGCRT